MSVRAFLYQETLTLSQLMDSDSDCKKAVELQGVGGFGVACVPVSVPFASLPPASGCWEESHRAALPCHTLPPGTFHLAMALKVVIAPNSGLKVTQSAHTSSPVVLGYLSQQ